MHAPLGRHWADDHRLSLALGLRLRAGFPWKGSLGCRPVSLQTVLSLLHEPTGDCPAGRSLPSLEWNKSDLLVGTLRRGNGGLTDN
jgi:hypothetical protein